MPGDGQGERGARKRPDAARGETVAWRAVGPGRSSGEVPAWRGGGGAKGLACSRFVHFVNRHRREERHGRAETRER